MVDDLRTLLTTILPYGWVIDSLDSIGWMAVADLRLPIGDRYVWIAALVDGKESRISIHSSISTTSFRLENLDSALDFLVEEMRRVERLARRAERVESWMT